MADFFEIDFLDVETKKSGDAICLRYEKSGLQYIHVVDGGYQSTGQRLVEHIRKYYDNPSYINHVVATHNDGDHSGGLRNVLESFDIGTLWMLRPWLYADEIIDRFSRYSNAHNLRAALRAAYSNLAALEEIAERHRITINEPFQGSVIGAFTVMAPTKARFLDLVVESDKTPASVAEASGALRFGQALTHKTQDAIEYVKATWGDESFPDSDTSNENEMSIVQYANICNRKILLTGDTGKNGLQELIDFAPRAELHLPGIDRFQVPHHGGRRNLTTKLLDSILGSRIPEKPERGRFSAIISSAKEDEDHPRKVVIRAMMHRGATVAVTEGRSIRTQYNAPKRDDWTGITPTEYPSEYEKD